MKRKRKRKKRKRKNSIKFCPWCQTLWPRAIASSHFWCLARSYNGVRESSNGCHDIR